MPKRNSKPIRRKRVFLKKGRKNIEKSRFSDYFNRNSNQNGHEKECRFYEKNSRYDRRLRQRRPRSASVAWEEPGYGARRHRQPFARAGRKRAAGCSGHGDFGCGGLEKGVPSRCRDSLRRLEKRPAAAGARICEICEYGRQLRQSQPDSGIFCGYRRGGKGVRARIGHFNRLGPRYFFA